jgi:hypothetical protein
MRCSSWEGRDDAMGCALWVAGWRMLEFWLPLGMSPAAVQVATPQWHDHGSV